MLTTKSESARRLGLSPTSAENLIKSGALKVSSSSSKDKVTASSLLSELSRRYGALARILEITDPKVCLCGCGQFVNSLTAFIPGHNERVKHLIQTLRASSDELESRIATSIENQIRLRLEGGSEQDVKVLNLTKSYRELVSKSNKTVFLRVLEDSIKESYEKYGISIVLKSNEDLVKYGYNQIDKLSSKNGHSERAIVSLFSKVLLSKLKLVYNKNLPSNILKLR